MIIATPGIMYATAIVLNRIPILKIFLTPKILATANQAIRRRFPDYFFCFHRSLPVAMAALDLRIGRRHRTTTDFQTFWTIKSNLHRKLD